MIQILIEVLLCYFVLHESLRTKVSPNVRHDHSKLNALEQTSTEIPGHEQVDRVFVGNLPFTVTESQIRDIIALRIGDGKVKEVKIATGQKTKRPRGFLFVDLVDFQTAAAAVHLFDGYNMDGRILNSNLKYADDVSLIRTATQMVEKTKVVPLRPTLYSRTIYLSNLDYSLEIEEIYNMCDDLVGMGLVSDVRIPVDKETGSSRGFAYIEFKKSSSVDTAIRELSEVEVYGRILKVERMSKPKKKEVVLTLEQEEEDIFASLEY